MRLCDDDAEAASLICHSTCQMPALRRTVRTAFSVIITPFFVLIPLSLTSSRIRRFVLWSSILYFSLFAETKFLRTSSIVP